MDPDIDIMKRQMAEEVREKYALYQRVKELEEEVRSLKEQLRPKTLSGDEKTW